MVDKRADLTRSGRREPGLAIAATWSAGPETEPEETGLPEQPARIGRFTVLHELGSGAMGVVYAAYDSELDRKIAIKLVHSDNSERYADRQRRLLREAQAMARLAHPNVVAVHEVGIHRNQVYVAMEFVEGLTLKSWLRVDTSRPWDEILRVFIDAGRGLAAAHQAGLIHRDFKPENVLVGDSQRPRVVDFGLVRPADPSEDPTGRTIDSVLQTRSEVIRLRHSEVGLIVGTPAYMSPEQWRGGELDARSDQFSFCASLYEALYGELPFQGKTPHAISESVRRGKVSPPPSGSRVPGWVHRIIVRGLSRDPNDRWPSMRSLIAVLSIDPRRKRRLLIGTLAASIGLAGLGYASASLRTGPAVHTCEESADELRGVWGSTRRKATKTAFLGTGLAYGEEVWDRIDGRLTSYADEWVGIRTEVCVEHRDGRESDNLFDLRSACLADRRLSLAAAVDVLGSGTVEAAAGAVGLVAALPPLSRCNDNEALLAAVAPPDDPEAAAGVAAIQRSLTQAAARENAGQFFEALAITGPLLAEAEHLDYPPIIAQTLVRQGSLEMESGRLKEAEAKLYEALWIAMEAGDEESASEAIAKWTFVVGHMQGKVDEARALERLALVLAERTSMSSRLPHLVYNNLGAVAHRERDYRRARSFYGQALAASERARETNPLDLAGTLNNIGLTHSDEHDYAEALPYFRRALQTYTEVAGPHHPHLAATLTNTGEAELGLHDLTAARERYEQALTIFEGSLGPTHVNLAYAHLGLARVAAAEGIDHRERHHLKSAIELWSNAEALIPEFGEALEELAASDVAKGNVPAAIAVLRRAVDLHAAVEPLSEGHRRALISLAEQMIRGGSSEGARRLLSELVADPEAEKVDALGMADLDFALAQALLVTEPERARTLAEGALSAYIGPGLIAKRTRVEAWLEELGGEAHDLP